MRLNPRSTFPLMLAALAVWTCPARADPITAIYDIQVMQRQLLGADPEPFSQQFELRMSFDPDAGDQFNTYGLVSFSSVPLAVSEPPADLLPLPKSGTTTHRYDEFYLSVLAHAEVFLYNRVEQTQREYALKTSLSGFFASPPVTLTAENFPAHLGTKPLDSENFVFTQWMCAGRFGERCFDDPSQYLKSYAQYSGIATLREVESPVVPEPATILLVGGGLAILRRLRARPGRCV